VGADISTGIRTASIRAGSPTDDAGSGGRSQAGSRTDLHVTGQGPTPDPTPGSATTSGESRIVVPESALLALLGKRDENLREAEDLLDADVHVRGNELTLTGDPADVGFAERVFAELVVLASRGQQIDPDAVRRTVRMLADDGAAEGASPAEVLSLDILSRRGRTIRPKTLNQKRYVDAIDVNTIVFGIGPAGTGKTYLAMAKAVQALQAKQVTRIILTRPAVEAGERLGFLPGTLSEKIDPYLRPLYDALHDMLDQESVPKLMAAGTIEIAPLAYMRGRTLNDAFIILDEAQNTTPEQMKMFLTRLGFNSKIVVTGDVTQVDLPGGHLSGLQVVRQILDGVDDVHFAELTSSDVVRHRLVADIIDAYGRWDARQGGPKAVPNAPRNGPPQNRRDRRGR
jgi:phosphate starvation-inducible protein PhoH and related proteins